MAKTTVTVRMEDDFKAAAEAEFALLGVSHTDVIHGSYDYIIRHHRLPYSTDAEALDAMKSLLTQVALSATEISKKIVSRPELRTPDRDRHVDLLNRAAVELDANWNALKRARGGFLADRWHEALSAAKGLSYLLAMTWDREGARVPAVLTFTAPGEIIRACEVLITRTAAILEND